jgi:hypothetical protein
VNIHNIGVEGNGKILFYLLLLMCLESFFVLKDILLQYCCPCTQTSILVDMEHFSVLTIQRFQQVSVSVTQLILD